MALLWRKTLETGVDWQDTQHKELFERINRLMDAMLARKGKEEIVNLIKFLDSYVVTHFGAEDQAMAKLQFPGRNAHIAEHKSFKEQVAGLKKEVEAGANLAIVIQTQQSAVDWLTNHIGVVDKELGNFILQKTDPAKKSA
ncbi:MAG: hemerythrin family protein [Deltaproteobacteria bacterium]|nr:hemerythrin family protein [Deltaproteobacteria bacterium]